MTNPDFRAAPERELRLQTEELLRVVGPARLRVVRGQMWVTVDGRVDDYVLAAGDLFLIDRGTRALAQAIFAPACALVADEAAPAWPQRAG